MRICEYELCDNPLVRRKGEGLGMFAARRFCCEKCARAQNVLKNRRLREVHARNAALIADWLSRRLVA